MRNRSSAMAFTSKAKQKISAQIGLGINNSNDLQFKDKMTAIIEEQLRSENKYGISNGTILNDDVVDFSPPAYLDIKKDYYTKNEKVSMQCLV